MLYDDVAAVDALKARFLRYHTARFLSPEVVPDESFLLSLEETRRALQKTSLGIEFLITTMGLIGDAVESHGGISERDELLLIDALGVQGTTARNCLTLNRWITAEMRKGRPPETEAGTTPHGGG